jgi:hypothetical protein
MKGVITIARSYLRTVLEPNYWPTVGSYMAFSVELFRLLHLGRVDQTPDWIAFCEAAPPDGLGLNADVDQVKFAVSVIAEFMVIVWLRLVPV